MDKRRFLQALCSAGGCCLICRPLRNTSILPPLPDLLSERPVLSVPVEPADPLVPPWDPEAEARRLAEEDAAREREAADEVDKRLKRNLDFDRDYPNDRFIAASHLNTLKSCVARLGLAQSYIGHGNFNLVAFDDLLHYGKRVPTIGPFTRREQNLMDELFNVDADDYGFLGERVVDKLTWRIFEGSVAEVGQGGHKLLRDNSLAKYHSLQRDIGKSLMLTSGVRNVVKQMHLFMGKTLESGGNLSRASRSIAPPGYSYHTVGDFDVGTVELGARNFTAEFSRTLEFRRMMRLGYIDIRYTDGNDLGVRFEPWHVKIA